MHTRDRHGRGLRGPLALPNPLTSRPVPVPHRPRGAQYFLMCVQDAIADVASHCPDVIDEIDIGVDEVPDARTLWNNVGEYDAVPLAAAVEAVGGRHPRVVIYRRPLERRAADRDDLRELVHETLVDQIVALTGRSVDEIDPDEGED
ncbi:metallopeptidase family protein [Propionibacterium sp.]|uniref:metallopeptidase family protein n=1 Tax=Propionibacterium sp. TaxID=1977903 RepID=UPI0039ED939D